MTTAHPFRTGLLALGKSAVIALGVPVALVELWISLPAPSANAPWLSEGLWTRVVFVLVALIWLRALVVLTRELRNALHGGGALAGSSWSTRWAGAIAALVLLLASTHVLSPPRGVRTSSVDQVHHASTSNPSSERSGFAVVAAGECLADVAERHLGTRDAWTVLARLNFGLLQAGGGRFVDANLIRSGWCLLLPREASALPQEGSGAATPFPATRGGRHLLEELALLGLGVITTAALVRRLDTLRIAARSARNFREDLDPPDAALSDVDEAIAPFGDAPLIDWIDAANRLVSLVASRQGVRPDIRIVRAGPNGVVIYLARAVDCDAAPFVVAEGGLRWTLSLSASLQRIRTLADSFPRWAPWLIPLGDDGDDAWLLAIGPGRWLSIVGPPEQAENVLAGVLVGLRTLPWAEELQVELLDLTPPAASERCYQLVASSPAVLAELLAEPRSDRHDDSVSAWRRELLIVLGPDATVPGALGRTPTKAGVISIGVDGNDRLVLRDDRCVLEPIGVELRVPAPDHQALALIERLIDHAAAEPYLVPLVAPASAPRGRELSDVRLQLLGVQPRVSGLAGLIAPRDESRVVEVLAYLVLHPGSVRRERLERALFPHGGPRAESRLTDVLAALRSALAARTPDVAPCLSVRSEDVVLDVLIRSDWIDLLEALTAARQAAGPEARALLEEALRVEPLLPCDPYRWMASESLTSELAFRLCDGWHQLGLLAAAEGQFEAAEAAVRAGLRVEPTSELLVRDLMVLCDAVHDRRGVLESYEELESALIAVSGSEPTLATRQLFVQLTEASHRAG